MWILSLGWFLIISISSCALAAIGPNLHTNPSFEQGLTGWELMGSGELDNQEAHGGDYSMHMRGDSSNTWNVLATNRLALKQGQQYYLGIWCKVLGEGKLQIGLRSVSSAGASVNYSWYTIPIKAQDTWFLHELEITTTTNPNAVSFQVYILIDQYFEGDVRFDDLSINKIDPTLPNAPSSLTAQRCTSSIQLSWQPPTPASDGDIAEGGYNIYRSLEPLSRPEARYFLAHTMNRSWEDTGIGRNSYHYLVTSLDDVDNESETGAIAHVLGAATASGRVRDQFGQPLDKARVEILDSQEVKTDDKGMFYFPLIAEGEYIFRASKSGYRWQERTQLVESDNDYYLDFILIEDNIKPPQPINLEINSRNPGMLVLSWEPPASLSDKKISGFNIYRNRDMINDKLSAELVAEFVEVLTWSDLTIKPGQTYWYAVSLVDTALNESSISMSRSGVAIAPPKPQNISPASGEKYIDLPVTFSWEQLSNVDYYELELSRDEMFTPSKVLLIKVLDDSYFYKREVNYREGSDTKTIEIGLPDGKWFWRVRAIYLNGVRSQESEPSLLTSINTKFNIDNPTPGSVELDSFAKGLVPFSIPFLEVQPPVLSKEQTPAINFFLNSMEPCEGEVRILNSAGRIVFNLTQGVIIPGLHALSWRGFDNQGRSVSNGLYIIQVIMNLNNQRISSTAKVIVLR